MMREAKRLNSHLDCENRKCEERPAKRAINYAVAQNSGGVAGNRGSAQTDSVDAAGPLELDKVLEDSVLMFEDSQGLLLPQAHDAGGR